METFPKARLGGKFREFGMFSNTGGAAPACRPTGPLGPGCSEQRWIRTDSPGPRSPYSRGGRRRRGRAAAPSLACSSAAPRRRSCSGGPRPARRGSPPPWLPPCWRAASRARSAWPGERQGGAARCLGPGGLWIVCRQASQPGGGARQRGDKLTVVRTRRRASSAGHWARSLRAGNTGSGRAASRTPPVPGSPVWRNRYCMRRGCSTPGTRADRACPPHTACSHGLPPGPPLSDAPPTRPRPRPFPRPGSALAHPHVPRDPSCPGCWAKVSLSSSPQPPVETDPEPAPGNCLCCPGSTG